MFHSGNSLQLLQQVSEFMEFWFLLLKYSKYTLLSQNFMTCQAETGSYVQGIKFEKDSLQVLKFLGLSLQGFTVPSLGLMSASVENVEISKLSSSKNNNMLFLKKF